MAEDVIRNAVIQSLSAVGAKQEAQFYAEIFAAQDPERFALIVLDPRCLKNPLLESLVSNLRILADLKLSPVLLVGALDDDDTSVKFQSQRLTKALTGMNVGVSKLNTASYGLIDEVRKLTRAHRMPVLEISDRPGSLSLQDLVTAIAPAKTIFLQPSGGLSRGGNRVAVLNFDEIDATLAEGAVTPGQSVFLQTVAQIVATGDKNENHKTGVFVIASPLNLLAELFTTKGSGTLLRRKATMMHVTKLSALDQTRLQYSIDDAFGKSLKPEFLNRDIQTALIEADYRGGAIFTQRSGLSYLSKFWVLKAARGEGIARDIWGAACADVPSFFWRSRMSNPFNDWYMRACDGMQISGEWRVFWRGVDAADIQGAIVAAVGADDDFSS